MHEGKIYYRLFHRMAPWFRGTVSFNYSYFALVFLFLLLTHLYTILTIRQDPIWIKSFFLLYDMGEVVIECIGIIFLSIVIKRYAHRWIYLLYIGCLFVFLLLQFIEASLVKTMDLSLTEAFHTAFGADIHNFFELLRLTELGMWVWYGVFIAVVLSPLIGIALYTMAEKLSMKKPIALRVNALLGILCAIPVALSAMDGCVFHQLSHSDYSAYKKALPWKSTFFKIPLEKISFSSYLQPPVSQQEVMSVIAAHRPQVTKRPNIYLFVVESLREDYLTQETAPHLVAFKNAHIAPKIALSSANHTITSWFSIFHAAYPFYWAYTKNATFDQGSPPLHALKKLGYQMHIYSSAQINYYHFDQVLLGQDYSLAESITLMPHRGNILAAESDQAIMETFQKDLKNHSKEGHLYVFFLDSTHFNYSWPKEFPEQFTPADPVTWKLRLLSGDQFLPVLKNRYKNAIAFVDHLFQQTTETLKALERYQDSIIIFCGDHGEEFGEEGKLFHASHLSSMQMRIPLFYKFGETKQDVYLSSHIDIFPSIIDYIDPGHPALDYFNGHSIFRLDRPTLSVVARFNSCTHPYEFLMHNGQDILLTRFDKKTDIFSSSTLKILEAYQEGTRRPLSKQEAIARFQTQFGYLFPENTYIH